MDPSGKRTTRPAGPTFDLSSQATNRFAIATSPEAPAWPFPTAFSKTSYRPQLKPEEWEELRPVIKELYIDQKKTFNEVAKFLRENHDFNPTKRQFDGKVMKWGLRKNRKLEKQPEKKPESEAAEDRPGWVSVNVRTPESWRDVVGVGSMSPGGEHDVRQNEHTVLNSKIPERPRIENSEGNITTDGRHAHTLRNPQSSGRQPHGFETRSDSDKIKVVGPMEEDRDYSEPGLQSKNRLSPEISVDPSLSFRAQTKSPEREWPAATQGQSPSADGGTNQSAASPGGYSSPKLSMHNDRSNSKTSPPAHEPEKDEHMLKSMWSLVNVTSSPKLSGLFSAIKIDEDLPLLSATSRPVTPSGPVDYISSSQLGQVWHKGGRSHGGTRGVDNVTTLARGSDHGQSNYSGVNRQDSPFRSYFQQWIKLVERTISPLSEISPFPAARKTGSSISAINPFNPNKPVHIQIKESEVRLTKLERRLPHDNPGVISAVQQLAKLLMETGKSKRAESLYLRVALAKQRYLGTEHPETVTEYINIMLAKEQGGDYHEALQLHEKLNARIMQVFGPESELGINSRSVMGGIMYHLGKYEESESLWRQSLQLGLTHLGKNHVLIASLMADLGVNLWKSNPDEVALAVKLIREGFQIDSLLYGGPELVPLHHFGALSWILPLSGHYDESVTLARQLLQRCWKVDGIEHYATLYNLRRLSKALRMKGDLIGAEPKCRLSLIWCLQTMGEDHRQSMDSLEELGYLLATMELWTDCATKAEQLYSARVKKYGLETPEVQVPSTQLRKSYSMQGLYREAWEFEMRLDWITRNISILTILDEKPSRKWSRFEMDLEEEEREVRVVKKRRTFWSLEEDEDDEDESTPSEVE